MPSQRDHILDGILGWVDNTHLAVTLVPPPAAAIPSEPRTALGILDTSTWSLHTVATFSSAAMGVPEFVLSPDGKYALYFNREFRNDPYTPTLSEIELSTGTVMALPRLARVMGPYSGFTSLAWRTGTQTVAASTGFDT
ncbi:MAG TPA: hypothetical protein VLJ14_14545, partial [Ktedonobacterales bacterium]|nr:hypothetical protein [Ktedonobacterales bacterium]